MNRRRLLTQYAAWLALSAVPLTGTAAKTVRFRNDPFQLGVASGDPTSDGFVVWTRLAPEPLQPDSGLQQDNIEVAWTVAEDANMTRVVRRGRTVATANRAFAVHIELRGLRPNRPYWYRFRAGNAVSAIGRAWTTPNLYAPLPALRVGIASCQNYEHGFFHAYRHLVNDDPHLILHLGDYIYENNSGLIARRHAGPEPVDLTGYRIRHALYKTDPDLQAAHAHCPWLMIWDDHEVDNDYAGSIPEDDLDTEAFLKRRTAAYRAYYEHMPLRRMAAPNGGAMPLYHRVPFGDLVCFDLLDTRQYRSDQACPAEDAKGARFLSDCPAQNAPERTVLGDEQMHWFRRGFGKSRSRWNVIAQTTLLAPFNWARNAAAPATWNSDTWDGYPAARARLLQHIEEKKISNVVVLGADLHGFWVNDLFPDMSTDTQTPLASEFLTTSLSARGFAQAWMDQAKVHNPHVKYIRADRRGYSLADIDHARWRMQFRGIDSAVDRDSPVTTLASAEIQAGISGVKLIE